MRPRFAFIDPGPLVDGELSLVPASQRYYEDVFEAEVDQGNDPEETRRRLAAFFDAAPTGRQPADNTADPPRVPVYHFWMRPDPALRLPVRIAGGIGLRVGQTPELEYYSGHIGYHVYPPARGRHFAERAARLLLPLARAHAINPVWITCNPDNHASRRTCERLGATLVDIVNIPDGHAFQARGERQKCRYRLTLD